MLPLALRFEVPFAVGSSRSISSTGPFRIDIPAGALLAALFALSIALSTLLGMMFCDLGPDPRSEVSINRDGFFGDTI